MSFPGRSALIWSSVALGAAALNLATGTACCKNTYHAPPERARRLTPAIAEVEPNNDDRSATSLVEARDETRTRFEGSCDDGTRDIFVIASSAGRDGVACEIRSRHGGPPPARLHSPELGIESFVRGGRIELETNGKAVSVYLEIPCFRDPSRSDGYTGYVTALSDPGGYDP